MSYAWELEARKPDDYHCITANRGREFILRMNTGTDLVLALQAFARDNDVKIGKVHAAVMGGFQPARFQVWTPDTADPDNWHCETPMKIQNISMLLAISGIITPLPLEDGTIGPKPLVHFVIGGGWDCPTIGGHLLPGSIIKGSCELFITEMLGIEPLKKQEPGKFASLSWYQEISK